LRRFFSIDVGKNGNIIGSYGIFRDITDRKKTEEQNTIMALMLDNAPSTITVHDFNGRFLSYC